METNANKFAAEIFDTFVEICTKYKIDFSIGLDKAVATKSTVEVPGLNVGVENKPTTPKGAKARKPAKQKIIAPDTVNAFIKWFCETPVSSLYNVSRGSWSCESVNGLWKLTFATDDNHLKGRLGDAGSVLAFRPSNKPELLMMNGGQLAYGNSSPWRNGGVTAPQRIAMDATAMPVPLNIIMGQAPNGLGKSLEDISVIEWTGQEDIIVRLDNRRGYADKRWLEKRHFAGAALVKIGDDYFLLDADRQELEYCNFNAFFTKLPIITTRGPETVAEAYRLLLPTEFTTGQAYLRQGELFFEEVSDEYIRLKMFDCADKESKPTFINTYEMMMEMAASVAAAAYSGACRNVWDAISRAQGNDPILDSDSAILDRLNAAYNIEEVARDWEVNTELNTMVAPMGFAGSFKVETGKNIELGPRSENALNWGDRHQVTLLFNPAPDEYYAYGAVTHTEHHPLFLTKWHRIYKNRAAGAWNITGSVD